MKALVRFLCACFLSLVFLACATRETGAAPPDLAQDSLSDGFPNSGLTLDAAIDETASYFIPRLPKGAKVALASFDAPAGPLSDYIFEELWNRFEDSQNFIMVDRRNLERIEAEIKYQLGSGRVDDETAVSITKQYGVEILVYGQIVPIGQALGGREYRMTIYATDVEKAASSQRAFTVISDDRLASLLNVSPEDEVERAVSVMAGALDQKITIAVGRISYAGTQTVSNLSAWLKNSIISSAQKHQDKFQVASESETADFVVLSRGFTDKAPVEDSPVQAVVTGNYSPLDSGADVSLYLVSASGNKVVLASARFVIPASELERRRLSLLPEGDNAEVNLVDFEAKQDAVERYSGEDNKWVFSVTPDVLDGIYQDGDFMFMHIYSAQDCYFRILHIDVNGNTQVIYPVSEKDNNFIRAGETRRIPDNTLYRMGPPFGEEIILAAGYDQPFSVTPSSGIHPFSPEIIAGSFTVESDGNAAMSPSVTAKFSCTILPR